MKKLYGGNEKKLMGVVLQKGNLFNSISKCFISLIYSSHSGPKSLADLDFDLISRCFSIAAFELHHRFFD